jgi:glucan-binding YG repeat protein
LKDIQQQIINYNKTARSSKPIYIVIHDTGDPGATAQNEHDYFAGGNRDASADFFVDSNDIIQIIDTDSHYSWHCGDGRGVYGISNSNSLGIEMCLESNGNPSDETVQNTIDLTRYLMDKYDIDIDHVVRHYDASRKSCPNSFMANSWARWRDFKDRLSTGTIAGEWIQNADKNKWWYKHTDGSYTKDGWEKIKDKWYLFDSDGWMLYDWKLNGDYWYYLGESQDGAMKTGWLLKDNKWYYLADNGQMLLNWQKINNNWYYFNQNGEMITGWFKDNGYDYLTYSTGELITDIDVYGYHFDKDGHATKL